jgi:hypothetical protein
MEPEVPGMQPRGRSLDVARALFLMSDMNRRHRISDLPQIIHRGTIRKEGRRTIPISNVIRLKRTVQLRFEINF